MTSRDQILNSIRRGLQKQKKLDLPILDKSRFTEYDQVLSQFKSVLEGIGGKWVEIEKNNVDVEIKKSYPEAGTFCSASKASSLSTFELDSIKDPHELKDLEVAILDGSFGVAENAMVWVDYEHLEHRVIHAIVKNLVVILPKKEIVSNMLEAYRRIHAPSEGERGGFIAGPSKTADIERSLVYGAHGPHSLLVVLID